MGCLLHFIGGLVVAQQLMASINMGCFQKGKTFTTVRPPSQTPATPSSHIPGASSWGRAGSQIKAMAGIITKSSLGLGFMY